MRELAEQATPGPWRWDGSGGSLKAGDRYVLATSLKYHGTDEEGDYFTSHIDLLDPADAALIALAPELAAWALEAVAHIEATGRYLASMSDPSPAAVESEGLLAAFARIGEQG